MPIYEYKCPKCDRVVELKQKIAHAVAPMCCEENCNIEMDRIISRSSFQLKGTGWERDGYS